MPKVECARLVVDKVITEKEITDMVGMVVIKVDMDTMVASLRILHYFSLITRCTVNKNVSKSYLHLFFKLGRDFFKNLALLR